MVRKWVFSMENTMIIHYLPIYIYFECILRLLLLKFSKMLMFCHPEISLASLWWSKIFLLPHKPILTITGNYQTLARLQLLLVMAQLLCLIIVILCDIFSASQLQQHENPKIRKFIGRISSLIPLIANTYLWLPVHLYPL
jgi:hypothetical protein